MLRMDARVQKEGGQIMKAAIYCRLSKEDEDKIGESESIQNQDVICRGWFLPPNTIT